MASTSATGVRAEAILDAVIRAFAEGGYDAVHLREIASEAKVSMATIYEMYESRDVLCVAAMQRWMEQQLRASRPVPDPSLSPADRLLASIHHLLTPFLEQPVMLTVLAKVRMFPGGAALMEQAGFRAPPTARAAVGAGREERLTEIERLMVYHVLYSLIAHYAAGQLALEEIVPVFDASVHRLLDVPAAP